MAIFIFLVSLQALSKRVKPGTSAYRRKAQIGIRWFSKMQNSASGFKILDSTSGNLDSAIKMTLGHGLP